MQKTHLQIFAACEGDCEDALIVVCDLTEASS